MTERDDLISMATKLKHLKELIVAIEDWTDDGYMNEEIRIVDEIFAMLWKLWFLKGYELTEAEMELLKGSLNG